MATTNIGAGALANQLVDAWGDADRMGALLAEDAEWWVPPTAGVIGSPARGRDAIVAGLRYVFGRLFDPTTVRVSVNEAVADGSTAAVRITMWATSTTGKAYTNEYAVFLAERDGQIERITEYVDVAHAQQQLQA